MGEGKHWRLWLAWSLVAGLMVAGYAGAWGLVWRAVIVPHISSELTGLKTETFALEQVNGKATASSLAPNSSLELNQTRASLRARGTWMVPEAGNFVLRLECDDYGSLLLDRKEIISLRGMNDFNAGQAEILLEPGPHLLEIRLNNIEGRGWLRLLMQGPGEREFHLLPATQLRPINLGNLETWLRLAGWVETFSRWGLILLFGMAFVLAGLTRQDFATDAPGWRLGLVLVLNGILFAILLQYGQSLALDGPMGRDEHQFVASGALLARHGLLPYADYPYFHTPNLVAVYALLFLAHDELLLTARTFSAICGVGCAGIVYAFAFRHLVSQGLGLRVLVASGLAIALFSAPVFAYATGVAWNHDLSTFLALTGLLMHSCGLRSDKPGYWFLASGLAMGLASGVRLSFATLALAMAAMIFTTPGGVKVRFRLVAHFILGGLLGNLPVVALLLTHPQETIFGNLSFRRLYIEVVGGRESFSAQMEALWDGLSAAKKVDFPINVNWSIFALLGPLALAVSAAWRLFRRAAFAREGQLLFLALPALVFGALAPCPLNRQYFFPLIPVELMAWALSFSLIMNWLHRPLRLFKAARLGLATLFAATVVIASWQMALALWGPKKPIFYYWPAEKIAQFPEQIHLWGKEIQKAVGKGRVLTLTPIVALEGGLDIYPELTAAPFQWRLGRVMEGKQIQRQGILWPGNLEERFKDAPPEAILTGWESESTEAPMVAYAHQLGYLPQNVAPGLTLWLPTR